MEVYGMVILAIESKSNLPTVMQVATLAYNAERREMRIFCSNGSRFNVGNVGDVEYAHYVGTLYREGKVELSRNHLASWF